MIQLSCYGIETELYSLIEDALIKTCSSDYYFFLIQINIIALLIVYVAKNNWYLDKLYFNVVLNIKYIFS